MRFHPALVVGFVLFSAFLLVSWLVKTLSPKPKHLKTLCVLGSGGHTGEMFKLLATINRDRYSPRVYVAAKTDPLSLEKVALFEGSRTDYQKYSITRCREVLQPLYSVPPLFVVAFFESLILLFRTRPDLILTNGPGTCLPICLAAAFYRLFRRVRVVFVESFCRVVSLSGTGRILLKTHLADEILVHWPELHQRFPRTRYFGRVI
ncbi:putative UDP-N-acetylglucosamine transferase subunit ALG14 [Paratrimastix pyriformis]|uniref:UDP-N-acetylglucosamine transferase subunit ALG14 n=1 Tax=Paratrimastix pyriformis TaxID=342808 RepID=A0ABQ8URT7_9EUKA|nr:putative UDP-N-acetylglucosamine transferase subunit ALG14 [Paratrimastix pyriformis]